MSDAPCEFCGKPLPCEGWECQVAAAKQRGCTEIRPTGGPVRVIRHDGVMLEHEHADHPGYLGVVTVRYCGPKALDEHWVDGDGNKIPMTPEEAESFRVEEHALVFTDGHAAVTLYECCYAFWYLGSGKCAGTGLWKAGEWQLDEESLRRARELGEK